jgi:excisionase family DNA binding protein
MTTQLLTVQQVAQTLQTCDQTIIRWIKKGKLAASKTTAGFRIAQTDLDAYLNQGKVN